MFMIVHVVGLCSSQHLAEDNEGLLQLMPAAQFACWMQLEQDAGNLSTLQGPVYMLDLLPAYYALFGGWLGH